eukprot:GAHX01001987.1.p1 GENE.GAHX01001987.1~~GAHX01001987.1.p1  ORF type:complete len:133 (-),score=46.71 GAHX01001987.1:5-403(-)
MTNTETPYTFSYNTNPDSKLTIEELRHECLIKAKEYFQKKNIVYKSPSDYHREMLKTDNIENIKKKLKEKSEKRQLDKRSKIENKKRTKERKKKNPEKKIDLENKEIANQKKKNPSLTERSKQLAEKYKGIV